MPAIIAFFFKHLDQFIKFLRALTFKRIFLFGFFVSICNIGWVVFENRQTLYTQSFGRFDSAEWRTPMQLSDETKKAIELFVKDRSYVELVQVIDMDLYRNTRTAVYWYSDKPATNLVVHLGPYNKNSESRQGITLPLLTDDILQNKQMIMLINMKDECSPAEEGAMVKLYPALKPTLVTSCRFPIPPRGGERINGYFAVHLNKELSGFELDQLRLQASQLAMQIFMVDVNKK